MASLFADIIRVALHVRAWIETVVPVARQQVLKVALHVRAWIETEVRCEDVPNIESPSM